MAKDARPPYIKKSKSNESIYYDTLSDLGDEDDADNPDDAINSLVETIDTIVESNTSKSTMMSQKIERDEKTMNDLINNL